MSRFVHFNHVTQKASPENRQSYRDYLQQQEYVRDIGSAISSAGNQYSRTIQAVGQNISGEIKTMSKLQCDAIQKSTIQIVGALDKGFNQLSNVMQEGFNAVNNNLIDIKYQLQDVENAIYQIGGIIDRKLNAVIEQQYLTNMGIQQLIQISKIPEFQKERIYFFEEGLKFLNNALIDPKRYVDALENFLEAEKRKKTDYLVLYNIGLIYLYSSDNLDLEKAKEYFTKAGDYSDDELESESQRSQQIGFSNEKVSFSIIRKFAYESYQHLANAHLILGENEEAIIAANKAVKISSKALEAKYISAQANLFLGNEQAALELIKQLGEDNNYLIDAVFNPSLATINGLHDFIAQVNLNKKEEIENKLNSMLSIMDINSILGKKSNSLLEDLEKDSTLLNIIRLSQITG